MKMELNGDYVLIEPLYYPRVTKTGLILADEVEKNMEKLSPDYGEVVVVGKGILHQSGVLLEMPYKPRDRVWYLAFHVFPIFYNQKPHLLVRMHDVVGKVTEDEVVDELLISKEPSREICPVHGQDCRMVFAVKGGRRGVYCTIGKVYYTDDELIEMKSKKEGK